MTEPLETASETVDPAAFLPRFGLDSFRPGQRDVINAVLAGEDCLCVMPTGGGKSLCYQLPAVAMGGLTLVVSPLIALMKDQVDALLARGIRATLINSTLAPQEQFARLDAMREGAYDLVYVVPERFRSPRFIDAVRAIGLKRLAIDEAHCISEWGHDFRHDYMRLGKFRALLGNPPTIALTATATETVRLDIIEQLNLPSPRVFITGFSRPNLHYGVAQSGTNRRKDDDLVEFLNKHPGSGIIYASSRKRCEDVAEYVRGTTKRPTGVYHAGMTKEDRHAAQDAFMSDQNAIVVATTAFGMGIDKRDVRFVVHYNLPGTLEGYYQEAGRAGRDGLTSDCLMLFSHGDLRIQEFFIESSFPERRVVKQVYDYLRTCPEDPIELTQAELKEALGLQISNEGVGTCEQLLDKAGALERLEPRENLAIVRIDSDLPTLVDLLGKQAKNQRRVLQSLERIVGPRRFETVYFNPREVMLETELEPTSLTRTLRELCELKAFDYVPPFRGRAIHMLKRDVPFEKLEIDFAKLEERKEAGYAKLQQVVEFAQSRDCREQVILRYFGQTDSAPCGRCDNCARRGIRTVTSNTATTVPTAAPQAQRIDDAVRITLAGVARTRARFGKVIVAQMLCGSKSAKMTKFGLHRLSTYGMLSMLKQDVVTELIDALLSANYLEQVGWENERPVLQLATLGNEVMLGREAVGPLALRPDVIKQLQRIRAPGSDTKPTNSTPAASNPPAAKPTPVASAPVEPTRPQRLVESDDYGEMYEDDDSAEIVDADGRPLESQRPQPIAAPTPVGKPLAPPA
ncbi:MAG: RecQ family ATP-dependent DNA helicase, partial [Planctomycetaceae bacterium]|nr:RecQ family ATP-dependent DNA helicase [Planctomycetaceae bacterium]